MSPTLPRCLTATLVLAVATVAATLSPTADAAVHTMIVTSDPQYPWTERTDAGQDEPSDFRNARSRQLIQEQYRSIAAYRAARPGEDIPVFVNGDLTAYGHGWQREAMSELLDILGDNVHLGLGNHDYANNIRQPNGEGCANNGCARDSVLDLWRHVSNKPGAITFDFSAVPKGFGYRYEGSLAYGVRAAGWDRVLQMQLNNYPGYEVSFESTEGILPASFQIESSIPWLSRMISNHLAVPKYGRPEDRAFDFGIVHMHDARSAAADGVGELLKAGHVAAIFAGHFHRELGRYSSLGGVPVFLSGSASQRTYLIVEHDTEARTLSIFKVKNNDPAQRQLVQTIALENV